MLLLLQGSILVVTTIEAFVFGLAFAGAPGAPALMSAAAAVALLVARVRLRADRAGARRLVYVIEGVVLATFALDTALALLIAHRSLPVVAALTQFVMPVSLIALLGRSTRAAAGPPLPAVSAEGAS